MLVLSRKVGEKITIGDDIVVTVLDVNNGRIRLGIEAPTWLRVLREELVRTGPSDNELPGSDPGCWNVSGSGPALKSR